VSERPSFLAEVIGEAARLGLTWWERILVILAAALLAVAGRRTWAAIRPHLGPIEVPPLTPSGEVKPTNPSSSWGANVSPDGGPPGGDLGGG
jgi:hypothetical protein